MLDEALAELRTAIRLQPEYAHAHNELADLLATCPDARFRDPVQAIAEAKIALKLNPKLSTAWNTLGEAYYGDGQWQEAISALEKGLSLRKGGDSEDFFFLAMAHRQLGHNEEARQWYEKGVTWMDQHAPKDNWLRRCWESSDGEPSVQSILRSIQSKKHSVRLCRKPM